MSIFLKNSVFIDWQNLDFKVTNIKVEEGIEDKIQFIEIIPKDLNKNDLLIDCSNKLVTKSFACGHHHVYSALSRGMLPPKKTPQNFYEILKYIWWTLDKCLDLEMIKASALITALYCAKNGVTFVIDHHSSPFSVENSLNIIADAFDKVGISHLLCLELSDRDGEESKKKGLEETENYLKEKRKGLVGLHASFTVGNELLKKAVNLAEKYNSGIHVHCAEDLVDQNECMKIHNKRVVERFRDAGVLNFKKTILAHCLHLTDNERNILRKSETYIAENIESNLNNKVGYFNSAGLSDNIMLGTDGMHSDMLRSAKAAYFVGQGIEDVNMQMIYNRFRKVHKYLEENRLSGDGENNLVILDYDSLTEINKDNFLSHFIFGIESKHVDSVISCGKLIVKNKNVLKVNEKEILEFSREMGKKLWEKMGKT
jgi:cytosine/adenosine deaminase-related metal-dependent hydrolase